jgi:ribonucleoside-diphosphate reductase alpha subunit
MANNNWNDKKEELTVLLTKLASELGTNRIDVPLLVDTIADGLPDNISDNELLKLCAETCACKGPWHPDYERLGGSVLMHLGQTQTPATFSEAIDVMRKRYDHKARRPAPLISEQAHKIVMDNADLFNSAIEPGLDVHYNFFSARTLLNGYLKSIDGKQVETPQYLLMCVAVGMHLDDLRSALEAYYHLSRGHYIHGSPTLFNAGTCISQMSSCFLLQMVDDSIEGIYATLAKCAVISKSAGGIGVAAHKIRASGSLIRGTNGTSNGLVPMLKVFNETARYVDQCLSGDTIVYTTNRGPIEIERIMVGDTVITDSGEPGQVERILKEEKRSWLEIDIEHSTGPLRVTREHPLLAQHTQENRIGPWTDFIEAGELQAGDMLAFQRPAHEADIEDVSADDCRLYGLMIASGVFHDNDVSLTCFDQSPTHQFLVRYLSSKLIDHSRAKHERSGVVHYTVSTASVRFPFTKGQIYDSGPVPIIHPSMANLPIEKASQIVRGVLDGRATFENNEYSLAFEREQVIESIRYILMRMGVLTGGVHQTQGYALTIPCTERIRGLMLNDSAPDCSAWSKTLMFSKIRTITENDSDSPQIMYDLVIKRKIRSSPSYMTQSGIVHNGGGKRKGAFAIYIEPWHADVEQFIELRKTHGEENLRARDLFLALWVPDLLYKRQLEGGVWSLFCPNEAPGLYDVWGAKFEKLYTRYEREGRARKTVDARKFFDSIIDIQMETGVPYILNKDACNAMSNQQHLGTIQCSNLCAEIVQYTAPDEEAVCNLASVALPKFVVDEHTYDYDGLMACVRVAVRSLNRVIDGNAYPTEGARKSNMQHRPIALGVQGLADVFAIMKTAFGSPKSRQLNKLIFEAIYFAAITESNELAKRYGPHPSFPGSPMSKGKFQFDLRADYTGQPVELSGRWDWAPLRASVMEHGVRNSLLTAVMPTASTSQILNNNEGAEPFTENLYVRRVLSGEFTVTNKHLVRDLDELGLWNEEMTNQLIAHRGSVANIEGIPQEIRDRYKTVWEMKQRIIVDMAIDRAPFIDQSQSMNIFMSDPDPDEVRSLHFYAWKNGLKTGIYYLRTKPAAAAIQFTVEKKASVPETRPDERQNPLAAPDDINNIDQITCSRLNKDDCAMCGG